ncbi:MAG: RNA polymerase sigma factor [Candidatus Yonathbacteria bacterium]|nr:RNA polymerase sigma factor [Candidatus Yonathbacteria bacterium]
MTEKKQQKRKEVILTKAYHDYAKGMRSYSSFKTHDSATGDDLVQDTFIKTWKYLVKGGKINLMRAFLYHILNQLIIDEYRKHKTISLDELIGKGFEPSVDMTEHIFDIFDGNIGLLLIKELPEKYRRVLHLRYIQDLSIEEISLITKQSKNATAVQLHRGLEKLKKLYNRP